MGTPRRLESSVDYVSVILESAAQELERNSRSNLFQCLTHNISGGHEYWGAQADKMYKSPSTLEEALLGLELRSVLETGTENLVANFYESIRRNEISMSRWGFGLEFGLFVHYVEQLSIRDAVAGLRLKVVANHLCMLAGNMPLLDLLHRYVYVPGTSKEEICKDF